ncbi:helix-turn-helix transcriptional regulator [Actinomadura chibensis]|uniref:MarR family transcriptional regulator n=1 Tax=Actinomadura chibensis TaxID=392828 RepID=A0A5D0NQ81_9ACTN|nr:helix-turn-helix domain-containing protein [Actinomadura chibensis]TYB46354.1 MarR family transcriptional regulator [Actinomadura chibensis]
MESPDGRGWTFLTNHARVLIAIARDPEIRIRDISTGIGITERAAQLITNDLVDAGYLTRHRVGRRNTYTVDSDRPFRHPTEADQRVDALITLFTDHDEARTADRDPTGPGGPPDGPAVPQSPFDSAEGDPGGR